MLKSYNNKKKVLKSYNNKISPLFTNDCLIERVSNAQKAFLEKKKGLFLNKR